MIAAAESNVLGIKKGPAENREPLFASALAKLI